jgi:hypothetical protein
MKDQKSPQELQEILTNRLTLLQRVLKNISETKRLTDDELRLEMNRKHQKGREDNNDRCLHCRRPEWYTILDHDGYFNESSKNKDEWKITTRLYKRILDREIFEAVLKRTINDYSDEESMGESNEEVCTDLPYLRSLLTEYQVTPYSDSPLPERPRYVSRDLTLAEWEEYKRDRLNSDFGGHSQ